MNFLAHSGADHSTTQETLAHSGLKQAIAIFLFTSAILLFIYITIYGLTRLGYIELPISERKD